MSNGADQQECCILSICCWLAALTRRVHALAEKLTVATKVSQHHAHEAAEYFLSKYDVAPKGDLEAFIRHVSYVAREHPEWTIDQVIAEYITMDADLTPYITHIVNIARHHADEQE